MHIDLIILAYGGFDKTTLLCLNSIYPSFKKSPIIKLCVYDNASPDNSAELLIDYASKNQYLNIFLNNKNLGYGGGMNHAVNYSASDWVILVNSDIVFSSHALQYLIEAIETADPKIGLINPITNNAGNAQGLYSAANDANALFSEWQDLIEYPLDRLTPQRRSDFSCVAVRRNVWIQLKGLDPIYGRGYYEDFDFSVRAAAIGYESVICESSVVFHAGSASFSKDPEQSNLIKNNKKIFKKMHPFTPLLHQRVENYEILLYYLECLKTPLSITQLQAYRVRVKLRLNTAKNMMPKSFFKKLYWYLKISRITSRFSIYFPEIKSK